MARLTRGERFKDARLIHNKHGKQTMDQVSEATGLNKSMIQALENENDERSVGYDKIVLLSKHYGVSSDYLLCLSDIRSPSANKKAIIDQTGLSEDNVNLLEALQNASMDNNLEMANDLLSLILNPDFTLQYLLMKNTLNVSAPVYWHDKINSDDISEEELIVLSANTRKYGWVQLTGKEAFEYHCSKIANIIEQALIDKYKAVAKWEEGNGND